MTVYGSVFRHVLRRVDAERAHRISFAALRALAALPGGKALIRWVCRVPGQPVTALGLTFPNPLGLAAGFDKDGKGIDTLGALGFGFVEVGTVTAHAQPGNPRPRLFRLPDDRAIVNRMGFNNDGAPALARRLSRRAGKASGEPGAEPTRPVLRVGVNIGRSKTAPDDRAVEDYVTTTRLVAGYADYLVVNVSSPNTPGLRDLQAVEVLRPLLIAVRAAAGETAGRAVPLLVKIAPDLADDDIVAVAKLVVELGVDGVVATNTTVSREGLHSAPEEVRDTGEGGLSGPPVAGRSLEVLKLLRSHLGLDVTIISVGGIGSPEDARERLAAGATLVQAYTGLVYGGPFWPKRVLNGLRSDPASRLAGPADRPR